MRKIISEIRFLIALLSFLQIYLPVAASPDDTGSQLPDYYIYNGTPLYMTLETGQLLVKYESEIAEDDRYTVFTDRGIRIVDEWLVGDWSLLTHEVPMKNISYTDALIKELTATSEIVFASPAFSRGEGARIAVSQDILLRLKPDFIKNATAILSEISPQCRIIDESFGNMPGAFVLQSDSPNGFEVLALANTFAGDDRVEWAEPDFICFVEEAEPEVETIPDGTDQVSVSKDARLIPDDPLFYLQWAHLNTGQFGGVPGVDTDADLAWDITTGSPDIKILVLDDGVQLDHPDLNVLPGADFTYNLGNNGGPVNQCDNHGTSVAGDIAAKINNGIGCVGIAPDCMVLPARVFIRRVHDPCTMDHIYSIGWIVNALAWGLEQGARVSNSSYGGWWYEHESLTSTYKYTYDQGMVHFASAGNREIDGVIYPANLNVVNAVSMLKYDGTMYPGGHGPAMGICAPGIGVLTTDRTGPDGGSATDYVYAGGTSHSSPYAAGLAALILSAEPWLTPPEVEMRLLYSAVDYGEPGYDEYFGYGVVNAYRALRFTCGDCNGDFVVDSNDIICLSDYHFYCEPVPAQEYAGDINCNEEIDLADIVLLRLLVATGEGDCCR